MTWLPLCGGEDTAREHFDTLAHNASERRFLAIGFIESDARAGNGRETQAIAAIPFLELAEL